jgi:hypothetical protein
MWGARSGLTVAVLVLGGVVAVVAVGSLGEGARPAVVAAEAAAGDPAAEPAAYEPVVLPRTEVRHLASAANGVEYRLYVSLPPGYEADEDARYPVVYLLDSDYSFAIAKNVTEHLSDRNHLVETILVGVAYGGPLRYRLNRTRDYTPSHVPRLPADFGYQQEYQKASGGGPAFRRFLAEELVPFVDREYRTVPGDRTLVGHSYGGLFGAWVLVTSPELFTRYLLVSPSLWYDDHLLDRLEPRHASGHRRLRARVYLAVGSREHNSRRSMVADLEAFAARLRGRGYEGLELETEVFEEDTHNSVFPMALTRGVRFLFEGR